MSKHAEIQPHMYARKAIEKGADGLIAVAAGAGGHAGSQSPFALVQEIRQWFDSPLILSGAIAHARSNRATLAAGADLAYVWVAPLFRPLKPTSPPSTATWSWKGLRPMWSIRTTSPESTATICAAVSKPRASTLPTYLSLTYPPCHSKAEEVATPKRGATSGVPARALVSYETRLAIE